MNLKNTKIAILVEKFYEDQELWYPYYRLQEEGATPVLIGPEKGQAYASKHGYPAVAEQAVAKARAADYRGVIIPGGYSPDHMRRHPAMVKLVRDIYRRGHFAAAICHGGWMLASADIIRGVKVAGFFSIKDDLVNAGGKFVDAEVMVDKNIITSRTPKDLPAFMRAIVRAVKTTARSVIPHATGASIRG